MAMSVLAKVRAMKARGPILILRWVQLSIAVLILILAIYVANWYNMETRSMSAPGEINLMIFVPCWSIFSFVWIMVANAYIPMLQNPYIRLAVDTSNLLLNFVSFVALAAFLGGLEYCRGSVCGAARGAVAFASFEWVLWTATAFLVARECFFNKNGGGGWRRGGGSSARAAVVGPAGAAETKEMQTA